MLLGLLVVNEVFSSLVCFSERDSVQTRFDVFLSLFCFLYRSYLSSLLLFEEQYETLGECFRLSSDCATSTER